MFFVLLSALAAQGQTDLPQHFTLDGRLLEPGSATEPLLDNATVMTIQVLNPAKDCILYEEEQPVNTLGTNGYFSIRVGSNASATKRTTLDSNNSMNTVFYNRTTAISGKNSGGGACNYTPSAGEERFFRFFVKPSSASVAVQLSDDMPINSVPQAIVAQTLQGYSPTNFFRTSATSTQAKLDNLLTTEYNSITDLISGASPLYLPNDPAGTVFQSRTADPVAPTAGQVWYNSSDNRFKFYDGVSTVDVTSGAGTGTVTSVIAGAGLAGGTITTTGTISIADGGVTTVKLDDASVTEVKLADGAVSTSKLVDASVTEVKLVDDSVTTAKVVNEGITSAKLADNSVTSTKINAAAVTTAKIADSNVTNAKLATGIDASKITVGTLPVGVVPTGTDDTKLPLVGGTMTGVITMGDETNFAGFDLLNTGHITMNGQKTITIGRYDAGQEATLIGTLSPVNAGALWFNTTTGKLMFWSGTQEYEISESTSAGGDITAVNTNTGSGLSGGSTSGPVTLAINVDGTSIEIATNTLQIADGGVSTAKLADASVSTSKLVDASVTEVKLADGSVSTSKLVDASVTEVKLADDSVSTSKLVDGAVGSSKLANDAITTGKILDGTIVDADISATAGIAWSKISKIGASASDIGAVPDTRAISTNAGSGLAGGGDLSADRSLSVNVDDLTVEVNGSNALRVKDLGISTSKLADASVTEVKLADGAVSTNKLVDGAVTSAKIANGTITSVDVDTISIGKISSAVTEYFSYMPAGTECNSGEILKWDATNDRWLCDTDAVGVSSHSALTDLGADDHTQYALLAGRAGGQSFTGGTAASNNLTLDSTSNATKGFVLLQPTGGNVGIGTSAPGNILQVNSSTQFKGISVNNGTNEIVQLIGQAAGNDNGNITLLNGGLPGVQVLASGNSYFNGGNIGLGTTIPSTLLHLDGTGSNPLWIRSSSTTAAGLALINTDTGGRSWSLSSAGSSGPAPAGAFAIYDNTAAQTRLAILSTGNVGIGTTNPQALLDVAGVIRTEQICDEAGANCKDISAGWAAGVGTTRAINTNAGSGLTGGGDLSSDRNIAMNVDDATIEIATNTVQLKDGGVSTTKLADSAVATTKLADTSVTEAKLAANAVTNTKIADTAVTEAKLADGSVTSAKIEDGTIVSADIDTISIGKISSAAAEYFTYMPAGFECNTGEVLKWNATNDRWLCDTDLVGATDHGALTGLGDDDHAQYALLAGRAGGQNYRGGVNASDNLTLESTSNATKGHVILQPSGGYVGVGTTAPAYKLDVSSTSGDTFVRINSPLASTNSAIRFTKGNQSRWDVYADGSDETGSNAGSNFRLNSWADDGTTLIGMPFFIERSSGNVGIGTISPGARLEVDGSVRGTTFFSTADLPLNGGVNYVLSRSTNTNQAYIGFLKASIQQFLIGQPAGSDNLVFDSQTAGNFVFNNGNVGIGTTVPADKLEIQGGALVLGRQVAGAQPEEGGELVFKASPNNSGQSFHIDSYDSAGNEILRLRSDVNNTIMNFARDGNVGIGTTATPTKLTVEGSIQTKQAAHARVSLNHCGGPCPGYHTLEVWYNIGASLAHTSQNNDVSTFSISNGNVTILKEGTYIIRLYTIMIPTADKSHQYLMPFVNGTADALGASPSEYVYHAYMMAGWWSTVKGEFVGTFPAGTVLSYGYMPRQAHTFWAHDGYTGMEVIRQN